MSDLSDQSDFELLEGLKKGKRECYEILYHRYVETIHWFIYYIVRQKEAAEDLTQEVFIKLYHNAHLYRPTGSFSAWLHQIAKNMTLNYIRHEKRVQPMTVSESDSEHVAGIEDILKDKQTQPDDAAVTNEQLKIVENGLLQLSERDRQLITLCTVNELPQEEVAKILNCSVTSVKVGLHRARERLMKIVGIDVNKLGES